MASIDPPVAQFRLGMLIYDTRYRSMTIQTVALIGFMLFFGWLLLNTKANLEALDKPFQFGFLFNRAGYDINQMLVEYTNDDPHWWAAVVGLLNTLLVAFLGCLTATVLGVIAGVLRLSNNWVVSKLMTIYVESFRNIPLLLWIILIFAVLTEGTPQPRDFRGDDPAASMILADSVAITNRGTFIPSPVWGDGSMVVVITFLLSLIGIWFFGRWSKARQEKTGEILPNFWIKLGIFFIPALLVFFIISRSSLISSFCFDNIA